MGNESYTANFILSFQDYCTANNIDEPSEDIISKWKQQTTDTFNTSPHVEQVLHLFSIPNNRKKEIEYHEYTVSATGHDINNEKKILTIFLKLKFKK
jgi:hypothetical protein